MNNNKEDFLKAMQTKLAEEINTFLNIDLNYWDLHKVCSRYNIFGVSRREKVINYANPLNYREELLVSKSFGDLFLEIVERGCLEEVKEFIEMTEIDVHFQEEVALRIAAEHGHLDIVKYLVERYNSNINNEDGWTLAWAADHNHLDIVKYLLEHGANIHAGKTRPERALFKAIQAGHGDMVGYLLDQGAQENSENNGAMTEAIARVREAQYIFFRVCNCATFNERKRKLVKKFKAKEKTKL